MRADGKELQESRTAKGFDVRPKKILCSSVSGMAAYSYKFLWPDHDVTKEVNRANKFEPQ
jgi:hypothetical protein